MFCWSKFKLKTKTCEKTFFRRIHIKSQYIAFPNTSLYSTVNIRNCSISVMEFQKSAVWGSWLPFSFLRGVLQLFVIAPPPPAYGYASARNVVLQSWWWPNKQTMTMAFLQLDRVVARPSFSSNRLKPFIANADLRPQRGCALTSPLLNQCRADTAFVAITIFCVCLVKNIRTTYRSTRHRLRK